MNAPTRITSPSGLCVEVNSNGSIRRIDCGDIMINLFLGNEMDGGLSNIHLRRLDSSGAPAGIPLTGPGSPACHGFDDRGFHASGRWGDIAFRVRLILAESETAWFWHVEVKNVGDAEIRCDLIHTQDIGLAHYGAIRLNEFYVSQYIDHSPLEDAARGVAIASRQNQGMGGRFPWSLIGSMRRGVSWATDALQFYGLSARAGVGPDALGSGLPGKRLQHEHSMVAIQDAAFRLEPGQAAEGGFFGLFVADKPSATEPGDAGRIAEVFALPEASEPEWPETVEGSKGPVSLFSRGKLFRSEDLAENEIGRFFGGSRRHEERGEGGLHSFFCGERTHVVLKAKEFGVLRPHGHLMRTGSALVPDEAALTSTAWMGGVFHSMVTQGHVSINRFLSTCHSYLSLFRSHGQRVFVEIDGVWRLLDQPSAFEMRPEGCRWIYKHHGGVVEVVSEALVGRHELRLFLRVTGGGPLRFLISHHVAMNGDDGSGPIPARWERKGEDIFVRAIPESDVGWRFKDGAFVIRTTGGWLAKAGGDELLFEDGVSRRQPFLCLLSKPGREFGLIIEGRLISGEIGAAMPTLDQFWDQISGGVRIDPPVGSALAPAAARIGEILPWFIQNAFVHYLSPRGLEQYSGGGWGTRDVCQGAVELLLALGRFEPVRDLLVRVFKQQNEDGDWPQWFMFFDRERNIRPADSHGDIVYWPVVALSQYLAVTGDAAFLEERLPFFHPDGGAAAERATVWEHVGRALDLIRRRVIPGTRLAAYGHGDWNDALQPAKPEMRERLCSSWTVTLNYQALRGLAVALESIGRADEAAALRDEAAAVLGEFREQLLCDGVVAGLVYFHEDGRKDFLLHPADRRTGLSFSLLPMIHAIINEMFDAAEAAAHLACIREHLLGPDGARLFDRPLAYRGGPQTLFQRAESASFFGREIGVMYTHAHLRYCEALARFGDARSFFHALRQVVPIGLGEVVSPATPRQSNCYYSSSDAAFADRYEAFERYDALLRGEVPLEGGWRVYSSGPGIATRLIVQCFLGFRFGARELIIDPVIPPELDGMTARIEIFGHPVGVEYRTGSKGCGPLSVMVNGAETIFERERNSYRVGGARLAKSDLLKLLVPEGNQISIRLG